MPTAVLLKGDSGTEAGMTSMCGWNDDCAVGGGLKTPDKMPQKHSVNRCFLKKCAIFSKIGQENVFLPDFCNVLGRRADSYIFHHVTTLFTTSRCSLAVWRK